MLIKKAGCNFIKVGIESGSAKILKLMKKDITLGQIRKAAKLLREVGIHWTGYFMMGVVGEKEKDIYKTLDLVHEIKPDLALIGVYEPFPGTVMFNEGLKRDLVTESMSLKDFYSVMPNNYYKVDPNIQTDTISPERFSEIEIEVKEGFRKYNMRGGNILRMAWSKIDVYLREPKIFMEDFQKFKKYAWSKKS